MISCYVTGCFLVLLTDRGGREQGPGPRDGEEDDDLTLHQAGRPLQLPLHTQTGTRFMSEWYGNTTRSCETRVQRLFERSLFFGVTKIKYRVNSLCILLFLQSFYVIHFQNDLLIKSWTFKLHFCSFGDKAQAIYKKSRL